MSTKFEQLLDYLVNEEMDKANELFHEIVVEKSREIYENLIAEEAEEEEMDEAKAEEDEEMDESAEEEMDESAEDDEMDESAEEELEDSYMMDADDDMDDMGGDAGDDLLGDVEADSEKSEDEAIMDIKNAIAELEAAFADLEAAQGEEGGESDMDTEFGDEEGDEEDEEDNMEMMGMVREYRETVAKPSGDVAGANTGDKMSAAGATKSPISSGSGKPTSGANAKNIAAKGATHNEDGTSPKGKVGGVVKQGGKFVGNNTLNVDNAQTGVKKLAKVSKPADAEGHAAGAGTGDNSVKGATNTKSIVDKKIG